MAALDNFTTWADWLTATGVSEAKLHSQIRDNGNVLTLMVESDGSGEKSHGHASAATYNDLPTLNNKKGRLAHVEDFDAWFQYNGGLWVPTTMVGPSCDLYTDDMLTLPTDRGWTTAAAGTGSNRVMESVGTTRVRLSTGATSGGRGGFRSPEKVYSTARDSPVLWLTVQVADVLATTQTLMAFGLQDAVPGGSINDAASVSKTSAGTEGDWNVTTSAGGTATTTPVTGETGAGKKLWHIAILGTGEVRFYLGNVLKATHTTNIPTATMYLNFYCSTSDNSTKGMDVYRIRMLSREL